MLCIGYPQRPESVEITTPPMMESFKNEAELLQRKRYSLVEVKKKLETIMASNTVDPLQKFELKHQIIDIKVEIERVSQDLSTASANVSVSKHQQYTAEVITEFNTVDSNEISLRVGEVIFSVFINTSDWWEGYSERHACFGFFPRDHVLLRPSNPVPSKQNCEKLKKNLNRKSLAKSRESVPFRARAIFDYTAISDREISFQVGDAMIVFREDEVDGWWGGEIEGKVGYFPKDFVLSVGDKTNDKIIKKCLVKKIHALRVSNQIDVQFHAKAILDFYPPPESDDAYILLPISSGETVAVFSTWGDDGWWLGGSGRNTGYFPKIFVERTNIIPSPESPQSPKKVALRKFKDIFVQKRQPIRTSSENIDDSDGPRCTSPRMTSNEREKEASVESEEKIKEELYLWKQKHSIVQTMYETEMQKSNFLEKQMNMWMQKYEEEQEKNRNLLLEIKNLKGVQANEQPKPPASPSISSHSPTLVPVPFPVSASVPNPVPSSGLNLSPNSSPNLVSHPSPTTSGGGTVRRSTFSPRARVSLLDIPATLADSGQSTLSKSGQSTPDPNWSIANMFPPETASVPVASPKPESQAKAKVAELLKRVSQKNLLSSDSKGSQNDKKDGTTPPIAIKPIPIHPRSSSPSTSSTTSSSPKKTKPPLSSSQPLRRIGTAPISSWNSSSSPSAAAPLPSAPSNRKLPTHNSFSTLSSVSSPGISPISPPLPSPTSSSSAPSSPSTSPSPSPSLLPSPSPSPPPSLSLSPTTIVLAAVELPVPKKKFSFSKKPPTGGGGGGGRGGEGGGGGRRASFSRSKSMNIVIEDKHPKQQVKSAHT